MARPQVTSLSAISQGSEWQGSAGCWGLAISLHRSVNGQAKDSREVSQIHPLLFQCAPKVTSDTFVIGSQCKLW